MKEGKKYVFGIRGVKRKAKPGWKKKVVVRRGRIARLPKVVRDRLNGMFDDGKLVKEMMEMVRAETGVKLKWRMLTDWRKGGYKDWQDEERRLKELDRKRAFALKVVRRSKGKVVAEAGLEIAAAQIYELLEELDVERLKEKLRENPEAYPRLVGVLARVSEGGLKFEKHRMEKEKAEAEKEALGEEKEASDEEMDEVLRALRVM